MAVPDTMRPSPPAITRERTNVGVALMPQTAQYPRQGRLLPVARHLCLPISPR